MDASNFGLIICRYNDPEFSKRAGNVGEARGIARYVFSRGFVPVSSVLTLASETEAPEDVPKIRPHVIGASTALARLVGWAGGVAFVAGWYDATGGMQADLDAYRATAGANEKIVRLTWEQVAPFVSKWGGEDA